MTTLHDFNFSKWDKYLTDMFGVKIAWGQGPDHLEHPLYDQEMLALAREFEASDYFDVNFARTLMQKGFTEQITEDDVREIANESDDFFTLRAIASLLIHNERQMEGMWAAMSENGILKTLLKRVKALTPEGYPNW